MISAVVIADSVSPMGSRLTTLELRGVPKWMVAQFNTDRMKCRNSASSRAVPTLKIVAQVRDDPYKPPRWNYRQRGMQPAGPMSEVDARQMDEIEAEIREAVLKGVAKMEHLKAAKEDINRYLEPWMKTTIVATATEWENYISLRAHEEAQAPHAMLGHAVKDALEASMPVPRPAWGRYDLRASWHLPYVTEEERGSIEDWRHLPLVSATRCAGVSYFRQGAREDRTLQQEVERALDLVRNRHWSPTEMPAVAPFERVESWYGPYLGWRPLRKFYGGESGSDRHGTRNDASWVLR